jgi:hypothetical protein
MSLKAGLPGTEADQELGGAADNYDQPERGQVAASFFLV